MIKQVVNKMGSIPIRVTNHRINYPMTDGFETIGMIMVYGAQKIKYENGKYPLKKLIQD